MLLLLLLSISGVVLSQRQGPCTLGLSAKTHNLKCASNGYFELVQCKDDYCVCVDVRDGTEARHTRTANSRVVPQCGACHNELAKLVSNSYSVFPTCEVKTGKYSRTQCLNPEFCYCVNPIDGKRLNKIVKKSDEINCDPYSGDIDIMYKPKNNYQEESPLASPICKLPKDNGTTCSAAPTVRFYFDVETFECLAFRFNGCGGNPNNFDSQSECWHSCKMADFFSCSGLHKSARDKNGDSINCGSPGLVPGAVGNVKCPEGYKCVNGPFTGICCDAKNEEVFSRNYSPTCKRGKPHSVESGGIDMILLGKSCNDRFCPLRSECIQQEHFAHCCI